MTHDDEADPALVAPPRTPRRGRPVSAQSRRKVLAAAVALLDERGWGGFVVDEVARRSGVSKATIYKHWPHGYALAATAYGEHLTTAVPTLATGEPVADLRDQVHRLATFYAGDRGRVVAQLLAAGIGREGGADVLRELFFAPRRTATVRLVEDAKTRGQLTTPLDAELVVDLLFGPIVFRLVNGLAPLHPDQAVEIADVALRGLDAGDAGACG